MDTSGRVRIEALERQLSRALGERNRAIDALKDHLESPEWRALLEAKSRGPGDVPTVRREGEPPLTDSQALAAEVLLIDASLEFGEPGADVWVNCDDWARIVAMARAVGGT